MATVQKEADQDLEEQQNLNEELSEELVKISAALNNYNGQVVDLRTGVADLKTAQPWREDLDWMEKEMESAAKERTKAEKDINLLMGTLRKQEMETKNLLGLLEKKSKELDHLKTEIEVLRNYSQSSLHNAKTNVFSAIATLQNR